MAPWTLSKQQHATLAGLVGNILEWYDFAVYGAMAENIGAAFFPGTCGDAGGPNATSTAATATTTYGSTTTAAASAASDAVCVDHNLIESFAVFGGAFLMRPVGAAVFGRIGDITGRKRALELSVLVMCMATVAMGCLPTYKQAGVAAPVLLCIVRLVQGVSVGGELVGSIVYTTETAPPHQWGLYASMSLQTAVLGTALGMLVGAIMHAALSDEQLNEWGWRVPFLAGIVLGVVGIWLRRKIDDSALFLAAKEEGKLHDAPLLLAVTKHRAATATVFGVVALWASGFYVCFVWIRVYMHVISPNPIGASHSIAAGMLVWLCVAFPAMGHASDVVRSRDRVMLCGGAGMAVLSAVLFLQARDGKVGGVCALLLINAVALAAWGAPMCAWMVESFPIEARYSAVAIGYNSAHAAIGGATLLLCTYLATEVDSMAPGYYMTAVAVASTALLFASPGWLRERHGPVIGGGGSSSSGGGGGAANATFKNVLAAKDGKGEVIEMSDIGESAGAKPRLGRLGGADGDSDGGSDGDAAEHAADPTAYASEA